MSISPNPTSAEDSPIEVRPHPNTSLPVNGHQTAGKDQPVSNLEQTPTPATKSDDRPLRKRVLDLAWPVIGENFMETLLGIVDTFMVAQLGAAAIAGVGSAIQVLFFVISALSALSVGSAVLVAQAYGARDLARAGTLARQSMLWSVLISLPLAFFGFLLARPIIGLFGLEAEVAQMGIDYLQVTMGTSVVMTTMLLGGGVLRGADDSRTPMLIKVVANIVNVGLTYGLIFGAFGLPELGVVGSAWGTFIARTLGLVMLVTVLWRGRNGVSIGGSGSWRPNVGIARQVLKIGVPAALEQVIISTAFFILTMTVAGLGTLTFAAHRIVMISMSLSFMPGLGFSIAATSLVGQSVGAKRLDEAAESARIATRWAVIWMTTIGFFLFTLAPLIMTLFADDPQVIALGAGGLRTISLSQAFWAIFLVNAGALRGTGNTQFPLRVNTIAIWIAVGLAYSFMRFFDAGLVGAWSGFLIVAPFSAVIITRRFRKTITEFSPQPVS